MAAEIRVARHDGPRADLRSLFELAEGSPTQLDSYLHCGRVLVAIEDDRILGHLQLTETAVPGEVEIKNMGVLESHRRRGIGRMLVESAIQLAGEESHDTMRVATAAADLDTLRFYQRLGFRMRSIERDAFTAATGYGQTSFGGIALRDRVWLDLPLRSRPAAVPVHLYERQVNSLVGSWRHYATGSAGATVYEEKGAHIAVFPSNPEQLVYNNALVDRDLDAEQSARALSAMESRYAEAEIDSFAVWIHESHETGLAEVEGRGYRFDTSTRAMAMPLDEIAVARPELELAEPDWHEYLRTIGAPEGLLENIDTTPFHVLIVRASGKSVAGAMAYDVDGDCGISSLGTVPEARRQGLGTALTAVHLYNARDRGCATASLQSTEMAERVYASLGFRDLGRYLEYVR
jgi:GNAT superfamily N-acetyltransferase